MNRKISPNILIIGSFIYIIFIGSILLYMPFTHNEYYVSYFDALFTSASAVTVTGLVVNDISLTFNIYGKFVIMVLIQLGGLGVLTLSSMILLLISKKISYFTKKVVADDLNHEAKFDFYSHIKKVAIVVFLIEFIGAILLFISFIKQFDFKTALFYSIFHSISAFCNAGFSLFSDSLVGYTFNILIIGTISILIIFGGLGFEFIINIYERIFKIKRRLSINTKFTGIITLFLLIIGTILFFLTEDTNINTITSMNFFQKFIVSLFQSVSSRTAGFNSIDLANIRPATVIFMCILMFVGASSGSTGGGIKTNTIGVLFLGIKASLTKQEYIEFSKRRVSWNIFNKASALLIIASAYLFIMLIILLMLNPEIEPLKILFELVSAMGTVGLSMGITSQLSFLSKIIIIITMLLGRVGPLTIVFALSASIKSKGKYKYPEENLLIG